MATGTPFPAYKGNEPYIFVCYAHEDSDLVYRELSRLRDAGFNIWYDEGIEPGAEWSAEIAEHIENCSAFLYFVTPASVEREYCRREINFALDRQRTILHVHLQPTDVPAALELSLNHRQAILRPQMSRKDYEAKLEQALNTALANTHAPDEASPPRATQRMPERTIAARLATLLGISGLVAALWWVGQSDGVRSPTATSDSLSECEPLTIAVMPFANLSGDPDQDYFSAGMSQEVWNMLASVGEFRLISMNSTRSLTGEKLDAREARVRLGAHAFVEGTVIKQGNLARISVQLVDANTGLESWTEVYDRSLETTEDMFSLYDEITRSVASSLLQSLRNPNLDWDLVREAPENLEAYSLFLQANHVLRTTANPAAALELLESSLALDADYIDALVLKGYLLTNAVQWTLLPQSHYEEAEEILQAIAERDPSNFWTYTILAYLYTNRDADFPKAIAMLSKAVSLGAPLEFLYVSLDSMFGASGEWRANVALFERVVAEDPNSPGVAVQLAHSRAQLGEIEAVRPVFDDLVKANPTNMYVNGIALKYYINLAQDFAAANALVSTFSEKAGSFWRARIQAALGNRAPLRGLLSRDARLPMTMNTLLESYFLAGDYDEHIMAFREALQEPRTIWMYQMPNTRQDYWETLESWAASEANLSQERSNLVEQHRAAIKRATARMIFPEAPEEVLKTLDQRKYQCAPV